MYLFGAHRLMIWKMLNNLSTWQKRKYVEEKTPAKFKYKRNSIASVPYPELTTAILLTPLFLTVQYLFGPLIIRRLAGDVESVSFLEAAKTSYSIITLNEKENL
jgi:hypothetical protein